MKDLAPINPMQLKQLFCTNLPLLLNEKWVLKTVVLKRPLACTSQTYTIQHAPKENPSLVLSEVKEHFVLMPFKYCDFSGSRNWTIEQSSE